MEHTSAPPVEQAVQATGERTRVDDSLILKASTSSVPEGAAGATPPDAELVDHVSSLRLHFLELYRCANSAPDGSSPRRCA